MADHALATVSNPDSALTDFTLVVDLSTMPADWWTAVSSSDGTRGRVYKGDGSTRLAADWIDFDDTAETGLLRVLWSGSLATTGTQQLWIEPPVTGNAAVAAADTYGSDNAYDANWGGYWPNGGGTDRTSNGNDGTAEGGVTVAGVSGLIGPATDFDGTDDAVNIGRDASILPTGTTAMTVVALGNPDSYNSNSALYSSSLGAGMLVGYDEGTNIRGYAYADGWNYTEITKTTYLPTATWSHHALVYDGTNISYYVDSVARDTVADTDALSDDSTTVDGRIGAYPASNNTSLNGAFDGQIQHVSAHDVARSADWISHEYDQTSDQATFYGTWSWETSGGSSTDALTVSDMTLSAPVLDSPALSQVHDLTATELTGGSAILDTPSLGQIHALSASDMTLAAPLLDSPTLSTEGEDALTVGDMTLSAPVLDSPSLGQVHELSIADMLLSAPLLDSPTLSTDDVDALDAEDMTLSAPVFDSPAIGQTHAISAGGMTLATALLDSPALAQVHALSATGLTLAAPVLDTPSLWNGLNLPVGPGRATVTAQQSTVTVTATQSTVTVTSKGE